VCSIGYLHKQLEISTLDVWGLDDGGSDVRVGGRRRSPEGEKIYCIS